MIYRGSLGEMDGTYEEVMNTSMLPAHNHTVYAIRNLGDLTNPTDKFTSIMAGVKTYKQTPNAAVAMSSSALSETGESKSHTNLQPYLTVNFCIAYEGLYPTRG